MVRMGESGHGCGGFLPRICGGDRIFGRGGGVRTAPDACVTGFEWISARVAWSCLSVLVTVKCCERAV